MICPHCGIPYEQETLITKICAKLEILPTNFSNRKKGATARGMYIMYKVFKDGLSIKAAGEQIGMKNANSHFLIESVNSKMQKNSKLKEIYQNI